MTLSKVWLIRGLPGSGKSHLANTIAAGERAYHFEADMFFQLNGYKFDRALLGDAHGWCLARFKEALKEGRSVVVSNTFTQSWEIFPYLQDCKEHGITPQVIECHASFGSVHGVPDATITKMRDRWEPTSVLLKGFTFG